MQATLQIMQATPLTIHLLLLASIALFCERERLVSCNALTHTHARTHTRTQAVVLGDSFSKRMVPVTYSLPHALIPVANVPLIEVCVDGGVYTRA